MTTTRRLPRTVDELRELMSQFRSDEAEAALGMAAEPTDVFISTYAKSGTTWLQQVAHQLRSGGSMEFEEISVAVPWLDMAYDMGVDPVDQPHPRVFKLHRVWDEVPAGGRVITAFRDPLAVLRSFYRFFSGAFFEAEAISLEDFTHGWFLEGSTSGLYFHHLISFYPHVRDEDVLAFTYEDMLEKPRKIARVVADFIGVGTDPETIAAATRHSSRDFMAANVERFDDHVMAQAMQARTGYPIADQLVKVHASSPEIRITRDLREAVAAKWTETVTAELGFADYGDFRAALPDPLGARS